ncbi:MAG TPA: DUF3187 family protein [Gammaproteobacteria bacterium]|jgi:hypothetical protein
MKPTSIGAAAATLLLLGCAQANAGAGFASREMNPVLQSIYLPALVPMSSDAGWRIDHSLYLTNTLQDMGSGDEELLIDAESYRYEFALRNRRGNWVTQITVPLVATEGGQLDSVIDDWHDFFGLPHGRRDRFARDNLDIEYRRDGDVQFSQTESSSGLGDLSLAIGYQPAGETGYYVGVDLPTGSADDFSGNEKTDVALWMQRTLEFATDTRAYGMLGVSFPGDGGKLEGLLVERVWAAQLGMEFRFTDNLLATAQLDMHSRTIDGSQLDAFGNSLQILLGLGFANLWDEYRLDLFFTEDILVGSAPDISFGLRLAREF